MEYTTMETETLQAKMKEIRSLADQDGADLNALETEAKEIRAELDRREAEESQKAEIRRKIAEGTDPEAREVEKQEDRKMSDVKEIRNSAAYIDAYANYIKTGRDDECRSLLTTNVETSGTLPVPDLIENTIRTAWERDDIMNRVRSTNLRGNVKIGFELSATGAVVHTEGTGAPEEEVITLGIVTMIPQTIKKWISISDEAMDMGGEEFLMYIYDELTYRIAKKCAELLLDLITGLPQAATATSVSADKVAAAPALGTAAAASAHLSSEATRPVIIMNRLTWAEFKAVQYAGNYAIDPFEGMEVLFNDHIPAYETATAGQTYMIIGDLFAGAQANYPNGSAIRIKMNDLSRAKEDIVEFVGRRYVGLGVTRDKAFALVTKPAQG